MQESKPSLYPSLSSFLWFLVTGSQQNDNWKVPEVYNSIHMFWYQGSNSGQARVLPVSPASRSWLMSGCIAQSRPGFTFLLFEPPNSWDHWHGPLCLVHISLLFITNLLLCLASELISTMRYPWLTSLTAVTNPWGEQLEGEASIELTGAKDIVRHDGEGMLTGVG